MEEENYAEEEELVDTIIDRLCELQAHLNYASANLDEISWWVGEIQKKNKRRKRLKKCKK